MSNGYDYKTSADLQCRIVELESEIVASHEVEDLNNRTIHNLQCQVKYLEGQVSSYERMLNIMFGHNSSK